MFTEEINTFQNDKRIRNKAENEWTGLKDFLRCKQHKQEEAGWSREVLSEARYLIHTAASLNSYLSPFFSSLHQLYQAASNNSQSQLNTGKIWGAFKNPIKVISQTKEIRTCAGEDWTSPPLFDWAISMCQQGWKPWTSSWRSKRCSMVFSVLQWKSLFKRSEVAQSCLTLCDPMDCNLPGSSLHGILRARVLEWVAISFSRGSSWPRDRTQVSRIPGRRLNLNHQAVSLFTLN